MEDYRKLTSQERRRLAAQGCTADDWETVEVSGGFDCYDIRNCRFAGTVRISGRVVLRNIGLLKDCRVEEGASIENTSVIETSLPANFGWGVRAAVVNESGGREVPLFGSLTSQIAYIIAMYRHRSATVERLLHLARIESVEPSSSRLCRIGGGTRINSCGILRNVLIGEDACLEGVSLLYNGSICSSRGQHTYVGPDVKLRDFIVCGNSTVDNGTVAERCFFGNAAHVSALTASDSLFFAGSHCENGEAASVLAGPYTISHHKSTLLIAGLFSFFNAGSGTNYSNHLLKSGPVHQGIHQRGCKYGSGAYMMLPALDGAFTTVIGRHKSHPDTQPFPFSLLVEQEGQSWLMPGGNLASCGAARDFAKWPARDKRDSLCGDIINFQECNPFTAERMEMGAAILRELSSRDAGDAVIYKRMRIKASMLRRGSRLYSLAIDKYIGAMLSLKTAPDRRGEGHWIDAAGMYLPARIMDEILEKTDDGRFDSIQALLSALNEAHSIYESCAKGWALDRLEKIIGHAPTALDIDEAVKRGEKASETLAAMAADDMQSENDFGMAVGYGIDSTDDTTRLADFKAARKL